MKSPLRKPTSDAKKDTRRKKLVVRVWGFRGLGFGGF